MISSRSYTLFPDTTLFRSLVRGIELDCLDRRRVGRLEDRIKAERSARSISTGMPLGRDLRRHRLQVHSRNIVRVLFGRMAGAQACNANGQNEGKDESAVHEALSMHGRAIWSRRFLLGSSAED